MDWKVEIQRQIDSRTEQYQKEGHDPGYSFIGDRRLRGAWSYLYENLERYSVDPVVIHLRQYILHQLDPKKSVVKIASILVRINWPEWSTFAAIFINGDKTRRDGNLPFKLKDLGTFLGQSYAQLFFVVQTMFLPITLEEGEDRDYGTQFCLPFNFESERPSRGSYGAVTKVKVARGYLKYRIEEYNDSNERIIARKVLSRPEDYDREVRNLQIIRSNAEKHGNIMGHIGTIVIGQEFNIFFEWAERDLHELFYKSDLHESDRPPHRLLTEAGQLAGAVHFLHENIQVDSNHRKCYHMDLKPENIVVCPRPEISNDPIGRWMITDFGISTFHDNFTGSRTTAQRYGGAFQPPEIDESWGKRIEGINEKGDIWALGGILCMVLAFAIGGTDSVNALRFARAYSAIRKQKQDFFYVLVDQGGNKEMTLKRSVRRWLMDVEESESETIWVSECVKLILWILRIDQTQRPTARQINEKLGVISRLSQPGGQLSRQNTDIPEFPQDSGHTLTRQATERLHDVTNSPGPTTRELATGTGALPSPFGRFFHFRKDSAHHIDKETIDINNVRRSTSTQDSEFNLTQPVNTPSSGSTDGLRLREGSRHTLEEVRTRSSKALPKDIALCPNGSHIVVCMKERSIVYERQQRYRGPAYTSVKFANACDHAYVAGLFYALQGTTGANIVLDSVNAEADNTFGTTSSADAESNLVFDLDISTKGIVALRLPTFVRLRVAKSALLTDARPNQSYTYTPSGPQLREEFLAVKFSADGERLMACSWKHWFLWDLRIVNQRTFASPTIRDLELGRAHGGYTPTIIPMTIRAAFLVYDSDSEKLWLYDSTLKPVTKSHCTMLCGIVTPQDSHLLYICSKRVRNSKRKHYILMRKSISLAETGDSQHLVLGEEKTASDLDGLQYNSDAILRLAFLQPGSSCDLIVASSTGEVVEVHLIDS